MDAHEVDMLLRDLIGRALQLYLEFTHGNACLPQ